MCQNNRNFGSVLKPDNKDLRIDERARDIAQFYAQEDNVVDDIEWLSKQENRERLIEALRYVSRHLPQVTKLLDEEPDIPWIRVIKRGDDFYWWQEWQGKAHRYLLEGLSRSTSVRAKVSSDRPGLLDWIVEWIKATEWPKWQWRNRKIKTAIWEIQDLYQKYGIEPSWQKIGDLIIEVFNLETPSDVTDWVRQLARRK